MKKRKVFPCRDCGEKFDVNSALRDHMLEVHGKQPKKVKCAKCQAVFGDKSLLKRHMQTDHPDESPSTAAADSDLLSSSASMRMRRGLDAGDPDAELELREASPEREERIKELVQKYTHFKCEECDKTYTAKQSLQRHVDFIHRGKARDEYKCEECGKVFNSKGGLKYHVEMHRDSTFQCEHCKEPFRHKHRYTKHLYETHNIGEPKPPRAVKAEKVKAESGDSEEASPSGSPSAPVKKEGAKVKRPRKKAKVAVNGTNRPGSAFSHPVRRQTSPPALIKDTHVAHTPSPQLVTAASTNSSASSSLSVAQMSANLVPASNGMSAQAQLQMLQQHRAKFDQLMSGRHAAGARVSNIDMLTLKVRVRCDSAML